MLTVKSPDEALMLIKDQFGRLCSGERVPLASARGRVLVSAVRAEEFVPGFDRSTVDGYAVAARDTFGCSEAMPALLELDGEVNMGQGAGEALRSGQTRAVPTGGAVPEGADAVVMMEYTEDFGGGTIGILKPAAPGENMIYRGDDVFPGKELLSAGHVLQSHDIGALAAMGVTEVEVVKKPKVGIISTGDELVEPGQLPGPGQVRNVNSPLLAALMEEFGASPLCYGIVRDEREELRAAIERAVSECDMVLVSGGSSVGARDAAAEVIGGMGEMLLHGIAMKPGKPTILAKVNGKPVFGLPGHPAAAYFVGRVFVRSALAAIMGKKERIFTLTARLTEPVSANHGRAQYMGVHLERVGGELFASPIRSKSGLISGFAGSDGFFCVPRDREGYARGESVEVTLYG